jgi:hypothetical protein
MDVLTKSHSQSVFDSTKTSRFHGSELLGFLVLVLLGRHCDKGITYVERLGGNCDKCCTESTNIFMATAETKNNHVARSLPLFLPPTVLSFVGFSK